MPVSLHWFLPDNGDSRTDLSLGNAVGAHGRRGSRPRPDARARDIDYLGPDRPGAEQLGFEARADPDRRLVRGRLAHDRDADPASPSG